MSVRLRLARQGVRNAPFYHIVAIKSTKRRGAMPLEKLGEFNPIPMVRNIAALPVQSKVFGKDKGRVQQEKQVKWDEDRIRWWLTHGAAPTQPVIKLLERGGILTAPHPYQSRYTPVPPGAEKLPSRLSKRERSTWRKELAEKVADSRYTWGNYSTSRYKDQGGKTVVSPLRVA